MGLIRTIIKWTHYSISALIRYIRVTLKQFPKTPDSCEIAPSASFSGVQNLSLGHWIHIGPKSFLEAKGGIIIEDGAVISSRVTILSSNHNYDSHETMPYGGQDILRPVRIEKGAWICYGALILPGVTIGEGAIVGAGAVVTKTVGPGQIVGGNPAKVIGVRRSGFWRQLLDNNKYRLRFKQCSTE